MKKLMVVPLLCGQLFDTKDVNKLAPEKGSYPAQSGRRNTNRYLRGSHAEQNRKQQQH
ncbi:hypothetical protein [Escherichia coli]|uniref:hypothetical protein n=1 Tax=Escherichia coli TaxID=562 RepID=UPI001F3E0C31|nr:hypothetical protein [Escherichia coli]